LDMAETWRRWPICCSHSHYIMVEAPKTQGHHISLDESREQVKGKAC